MFDPTTPPSRATLHDRLGAAASLWDAVIGQAKARAPQLTDVWHFAGKTVGWSLHLVAGDRIIVYLTPDADAFRVGLVLGGKAVAAAREVGVSPDAARHLDAAPKYAEGHGVKFPVTTRDDMAAFDELLAIKLAVPPATPRKSSTPTSPARSRRRPS